MNHDVDLGTAPEELEIERDTDRRAVTAFDPGRVTIEDEEVVDVEVGRERDARSGTRRGEEGVARRPEGRPSPDVHQPKTGQGPQDAEQSRCVPPRSVVDHGCMVSARRIRFLTD
jgi:hypothetical protein